MWYTFAAIIMHQARTYLKPCFDDSHRKHAHSGEGSSSGAKNQWLAAGERFTPIHKNFAHMSNNNIDFSTAASTAKVLARPTTQSNWWWSPADHYWHTKDGIKWEQ